ncbi:hypothetical protein GCM10009813_26280 [Brevibacterium marinum]
MHRCRISAAVAELTGVLDLSDWPDGMRINVRRESSHPDAQLRFDDVDGYRLTAFATNTTGNQLADLEVRHHSRTRCEDRTRFAKDSGFRVCQLPTQALRPEFHKINYIVELRRADVRDRIEFKKAWELDARQAVATHGHRVMFGCQNQAPTRI